MSERRRLLDTAAFLDSAQALRISEAPTKDVREIAQRFFAACYEDLGTAPRLLEGEDQISLLRVHLPRRYSRNDPLAAATGSVLAAILDWLDETEVVPHAFELRQRLLEHLAHFERLVQSGDALGEGGPVRPKQRTVRHRADKTGRNDPCPCGSGKKFKKCCMPIGG